MPDQIILSSEKEILKGIRQVNGLAPDFDKSTLEDGYLYLVRTSADKEFGYVYLNGKTYGADVNHLDCGTY